MTSWGELLREYPQLKTIGLMSGIGLTTGLAARAARRRGSSLSPALMGTLGALSPLAYEYLTNSGTMGNVNQKGWQGFTRATSDLMANTPNRAGYVRKYLRGLVGHGDESPIKDLWGSALPQRPAYAYKELDTPFRVPYDKHINSIMESTRPR